MSKSDKIDSMFDGEFWVKVDSEKKVRDAAPDLLEAVQCLRQHLALFCTKEDAIAKAVFDIADAAIAKATSE